MPEVEFNLKEQRPNTTLLKLSINPELSLFKSAIGVVDLWLTFGGFMSVVLMIIQYKQLHTNELKQTLTLYLYIESKHLLFLNVVHKPEQNLQFRSQ